MFGKNRSKKKFRLGIKLGQRAKSAPIDDEIETDTINKDNNNRVNYNGMYNGNMNTKREQGTSNKKLLGFSKRGTPVGIKKKYDLKSIKLKPTKSKKSIALKPPDSPHLTHSKPTSIDIVHDYQIQDKIKLKDGRKGSIRFVGQTKFSKKILYGIELNNDYTGENDGMVFGVRYFSTKKPKKGVFVTLDKIDSLVKTPKTVYEQPLPILTLSISNHSSNHHKKRLSTMLYNTQSFKKPNGRMKSRVSFVVPDLDQLLANSPKPSPKKIRKFKDMEDMDELKLDEIKEDIADDATPVANVKINGFRKPKNNDNSDKVRIKIPFGKLNSKCMGIILSYLTMNELSEFSLLSKSSRDSIKLVAKYDFRYLLRDMLSIQETRCILNLLKFHKPMELILPMAQFIYDPVILRIFLSFFNVERVTNNTELFKYIHKLVIDDRDIRPSTWIIRPGNYPWSNLYGNKKSNNNNNNSNDEDTVFPFELVECFNSLGDNLWYLDIRYTNNIELQYFLSSKLSIKYLYINAENRFNAIQFSELKELTIENRKSTWNELDRMECINWSESFTKLTKLTLINQRFNGNFIFLMACITWLPSLNELYIKNCKYNEPSLRLSLEHIYQKSQPNNNIKKLKLTQQKITETMFIGISWFFQKLISIEFNKILITNKNYDFDFFKPLSSLTAIKFTDLNTIKKQYNKKYYKWLDNVYNMVIKNLSVSTVLIEHSISNYSKSSHKKCPYCGDLVPNGWLKDHLNTVCKEYNVVCSLCNAKVKRDHLVYHWNKNCEKYYYQCFLCPKVFKNNQIQLLYKHLESHTTKLDNECAKYECVFLHNKQSLGLTNEYPIYVITKCKNCSYRVISNVVPKSKYHTLIQDTCDVCEANDLYPINNFGNNRSSIKSNNSNNNDNRRKSSSKYARISQIKKLGIKVLPHPYTNVKSKRKAKEYKRNISKKRWNGKKTRKWKPPQ